MNVLKTRASNGPIHEFMKLCCLQRVYLYNSIHVVVSATLDPWTVQVNQVDTESNKIRPADRIRWDFRWWNYCRIRWSDHNYYTHLISIHLISTRLQYWDSILPECRILSDLTVRFHRISTLGILMCFRFREFYRIS